MAVLPNYQILSKDQVRTIHEHALNILENTGIAVQHKRALEILADAGAKVDFNNQRVSFSQPSPGKSSAMPSCWEYVGRSQKAESGNPAVSPPGRMRSHVFSSSCRRWKTRCKKLVLCRKPCGWCWISRLRKSTMFSGEPSWQPMRTLSGG